MNSQLSKEINFEILFRHVEHVLGLREILIQKFHLWSALIGQSAKLRMKRRRCCLHYGFRKFICNVKVLTFKRKISNFFYFEIKFRNNFQCERGLMHWICGARRRKLESVQLSVSRNRPHIIRRIWTKLAMRPSDKLWMVMGGLIDRLSLLFSRKSVKWINFVFVANCLLQRVVSSNHLTKLWYFVFI